MKRDIFISHSSADKKEIDFFVAQLEKYGFSVWYDKNVILTGDNLLEEIKNGINSSLCIVLFLTNAFFQSCWTSLEIGFALEKIKIIPVFVDVSTETVVQKASFLFSLKYFNYQRETPQNSINALASEILKYKKLYGQQLSIDCLKIKKNLDCYNTMGSNAISALLSEYEKITEQGTSYLFINLSQQIATTIVNDVFSQTQNDISRSALIGIGDKLEATQNIFEKNVYSHIKALLIDIASIDRLGGSIAKNIVDQSLNTVLNWYIGFLYEQNLPGNQSDFAVVLPGDLSEQDFMDMYDIDTLVLREDLIAPPDTTIKWYKHNIYTHLAIRNTKRKKVVGYFAILPVTDELFELIQKGNFKDNDLSTEKIRQYNMPDFYKLYIAAIGIHPEYQNTCALGKLLFAAIDMMYKLAVERDIYITDIITEASTPQGARLCEIFKLKKLKNTDIDTELYTTSLLPPSLRLHNLFGKRLIEFYKVKYEELKDLI